MKKELCIAVYVYGWYVEFIPLYIHSILTSYPEYYVKIFTCSELPDNVNNALKFINSDSFEIISDFKVNDYPMNNHIVRWFIPREYFEDFKYGYIGDVDFIIVKELVSLLDSHVEHMEKLGLPYSNIIRKTLPTRMSGLHFFNVDEYFDGIEDKKNSFLAQMPLTSKNNEEVLFELTEDIGHPSIEEQWRPHHGFHLGLYRLHNQRYIREVQDREKWNSMKENGQIVMNSPVYEKLWRNAGIRVRNIMSDIKHYVNN